MHAPRATAKFRVFMRSGLRSVLVVHRNARAGFSPRAVFLFLVGSARRSEHVEQGSTRCWSPEPERCPPTVFRGASAGASLDLPSESFDPGTVQREAYVKATSYRTFLQELKRLSDKSHAEGHPLVVTGSRSTGLARWEIRSLSLLRHRSPHPCSVNEVARDDSPANQWILANQGNDGVCASVVIPLISGNPRVSSEYGCRSPNWGFRKDTLTSPLPERFCSRPTGPWRTGQAVASLDRRFAGRGSATLSSPPVRSASSPQPRRSGRAKQRDGDAP